MDSINERIREVRKKLKLSQTTFGARIGMSCSEIKNVEYGKTALKELKIPILCREFNVNYDWLVSGKGEMFEELSESVLDELAMSYKLKEDDIAVVKAYLELLPTEREAIKKFIANMAKKIDLPK